MREGQQCKLSECIRAMSWKVLVQMKERVLLKIRLKYDMYFRNLLDHIGLPIGSNKVVRPHRASKNVIKTRT